jgi:hypothetical protein
MAAALQSCTKQEMRSVIRFLNAEGNKPVEMYRRMLAKYISCMNEMQVYEFLLLLLLLTAIGFIPGGSVQYTSTKNTNTI